MSDTLTEHTPDVKLPPMTDAERDDAIRRIDSNMQWVCQELTMAKMAFQSMPGIGGKFKGGA